LEVRGQWTQFIPERLTWSTNLVATIPKDPKEVTDLARHTEGWGVTTELTVTPPAYPNLYSSIAPDPNGYRKTRIHRLLRHTDNRIYY